MSLLLYNDFSYFYWVYISNCVQGSGKMSFSSIKNLAYLTQVAFVMLTPILLGVYFGNMLDKKFDTSPWILLLCIVLGVGTAFLNLYKFIMTIVKNNEKESQKDYTPNLKDDDER